MASSEAQWVYEKFRATAGDLKKEIVESPFLQLCVAAYKDG